MAGVALRPMLTPELAQYMDELSSEKSRRCVCTRLVVLLSFPHNMAIGISASSSRSVLYVYRPETRPDQQLLKAWNRGKLSSASHSGFASETLLDV